MEINAKQERRLRTLFHDADSDRSGSLNADEMLGILRAIGRYTDSKQDIRMRISLVDTDGNGTLDVDEFISMFKKYFKWSNIGDSERELWEAFKVLDTDGNGKLSRDEFKEVMTAMGNACLSDDEFDALMRETDKNGDGEIDFSEYMKFISSNMTEQQELR